MKLIRFGKAGMQKTGIISRDRKRQGISSFGEDYDQHYFNVKEYFHSMKD